MSRRRTIREAAALAMTALLAIACAHAPAPPPPQESEAQRHARLAAQPTPATWRPGARWTFVHIDENGTRHSMTVRPSATKVLPLNSEGEWFALQVLAATPQSPVQWKDAAGTVPAWRVEGRNLTIEFVNERHRSYFYVGELDDAGFVGKARDATFEHLHGSGWGITFRGEVHGVPVAEAAND